MILPKIKYFLHKNGSTICTIIGSIGVGVTVVFAIKETKANKIIRAPIDIFKVYPKTITSGALTIGSIVLANYLNQKRINFLTSSLITLTAIHKEYRNKVKEQFGDEEELKIEESVTKSNIYGVLNKSLKDNIVSIYDEYSNRYFEITIEQYLEAIYQLNQLLAKTEVVSLNDFYDLLYVDRTELGKKLGWSYTSCGGYVWIDFDLKHVTLDDGFECYLIEMLTKPSEDYLDY